MSLPHEKNAIIDVQHRIQLPFSYLRLRIPPLVEFWPVVSSISLCFPFFFFSTSHILQNFKFSSPAPVQTTSPLGLNALQSTLHSCASRISTIRSMLG